MPATHRPYLDGTLLLNLIRDIEEAGQMDIESATQSIRASNDHTNLIYFSRTSSNFKSILPRSPLKITTK